jgi:hypothetical protein
MDIKKLFVSQKSRIHRDAIIINGQCGWIQMIFFSYSVLVESNNAGEICGQQIPPSIVFLKLIEVLSNFIP